MEPERLDEEQPQTIETLLRWAFGIEKARLYQDSRYIAPTKDPTEAVAELGVRVDTFKGSSFPHDDAMTIALALNELPPHLGGFRQALIVSRYASAMARPYLESAFISPKIQPQRWVKNRYGKTGATEKIGEIVEKIRVPHPKNPKKRITRTVRRESSRARGIRRYRKSRKSAANGSLGGMRFVSVEKMSLARA